MGIWSSKIFFLQVFTSKVLGVFHNNAYQP
jgi:hypothetical protein